MISTSMKPSASMKGSRSAARSGGRSAFSTAINGRHREGTALLDHGHARRMAAATHIASAVRSHESTS